MLRQGALGLDILATPGLRAGIHEGVKPKLKLAALLLLFTTYLPRTAAYSVLSHEVVIDLLWVDELQPLLRKKFPDATPDDLRQAHAYAYGGSIIQDMGYYPFGDRRFSDLAHYVRSGDFVLAMLRDAATLNEYAFALGALAHYAADTEGHPAVNRAVADEIPGLRRRYGPAVTYADNPKAHIRVEFGFDVAQVFRRRFPSDSVSQERQQAPKREHQRLGSAYAT